MDRDTGLKRLRFRAHHRGTKEADLLLGGFFEAHHDRWDAAAIALFEALLEEQDADILGWAMGAIEVPERWQGAMMSALQRLDYVRQP
ncbi:MAG: succinate dehydrogenase assembly factor 2 [Alphaproteobacteria bacterium]|nr:succinate dehydrogenase assembly factor 2 [Alphaproteobacteria bacterium]MDE2042812.1 succinate dehydrogenase assembly factor 2 [Alphaproteobacteria bacterium]MDE2340137.1 succinate dehydrogenase assembly factor 2 [Alphaproteobacteria bacterium]